MDKSTTIMAVYIFLLVFLISACCLLIVAGFPVDLKTPPIPPQKNYFLTLPLTHQSFYITYIDDELVCIIQSDSFIRCLSSEHVESMMNDDTAIITKTHIDIDDY